MNTKLKYAVFVLISASVVFQTYRVFVDAGVLIEISDKPYGKCEKLFGPQGSEDIEIDRQNEVLFISSANSRALLDARQTGSDQRVGNGDIWLLEIDSERNPRKLNVEVGGPFHPHGIDLLTLENGQRELYVINHPTRDEHEILIFSIQDDNSLTLRRRVTYPELISPNDIKAISQDRFLVTNDHGSPTSSLMARIEEYAGLSRSSVSFFDGKKGSLVIKNIKSANGITLSQDNNTLYVAEAIGRSVIKYARGEDHSTWHFKEKLPTNTAVDNLEWSDSGLLLAGAHPKLFDLVAHFKDRDKHSPSEVIAINTSSPMSVKTIYMNDGSQISGSSVAIERRNELFIGSVAEPHFLRCKSNSTE